MLVYAAASTGVAYLIKPIIDQVLPGQGGWPFRLWAGLIIGDVIVSIAGHAIEEPETLVTVLRPDRVGAAVTMSILRGGEPREVQVTVGERPSPA